VALEQEDRVKDQTATTGTGTVTIDGVAPTGYRTFAAAHASGDTVRYTIVNSDLSEWEVGQGVWTAAGTTLTRVTVYASSNAGALVSFSAGTKVVFTGPTAAFSDVAPTLGWYSPSADLIRTPNSVTVDDTITASNLSVTGFARRNAIINGDFMIWQEGTSFVSPAATTYTADMWTQYNNSGATYTISKSADAPTVAQASRLIVDTMLVDITGADGTVDAGDFTVIYTKIEGYNFRALAQVSMTLSFWHKHTDTGTYCVAVQNSGQDRSYVAEYTQAVSDTWEYASVVIPASPTAGTWNYTSSIGLQVFFTMSCGTTYQTTAGSWQTGNYYGTSGQVNTILDNTANIFMLAGVQLERGSVATEFDARTWQEELALCQRYYYKTFSVGVAPAQNTGSAAGALAQNISTAGVGNKTVYWQFPCSMRTAPTIVTYNPNAANALWRNQDAAADSGANTSANASSAGVTMINAGVAGDTAAQRAVIHATADARL
tara:strand:- start:1269 stop:2735 length:1467 start_codon:yes stop_codon:yes gene_type:complete